MSSARNFIGTLNNPDTTTCREYLQAWSKVKACTYATGQLEKGKEGTVHLQYFLNFNTKQRIAALKKHCPKSHFELVLVNNGADDYCNKEETRVEGPWTFGVKPARLNKKGDKAAQNKQLLEIGAEKAVEDGLIGIERYINVKKNLDAYRLATAKPCESDSTRGVWIWGPPGIGKSRLARDTYPDIYLKA